MLNTVILLRRHARAHAALAEAMARRESVVRCIEVVEANLGDAPLRPPRGEGGAGEAEAGVDLGDDVEFGGGEEGAGGQAALLAAALAGARPAMWGGAGHHGVSPPGGGGKRLDSSGATSAAQHESQ